MLAAIDIIRLQHPTEIEKGISLCLDQASLSRPSPGESH